MNAQQKHDSDVATCRICTLAQNMRGCESCRFNVGLVASSAPLGITAWITEAAAQMADALDWMQQTNELRAG